MGRKHVFVAVIVVLVLHLFADGMGLVDLAEEGPRVAFAVGGRNVLGVILIAGDGIGGGVGVEIGP